MYAPQGLLPRCIVRFDLRRFGIVLPDLLCWEADAVRVKDLQAPLRVLNVPVDQSGVRLRFANRPATAFRRKANVHFR